MREPEINSMTDFEMTPFEPMTEAEVEYWRTHVNDLSEDQMSPLILSCGKYKGQGVISIAVNTNGVWYRTFVSPKAILSLTSELNLMAMKTVIDSHKSDQEIETTGDQMIAMIALRNMADKLDPHNPDNALSQAISQAFITSVKDTDQAVSTADAVMELFQDSVHAAISSKEVAVEIAQIIAKNLETPVD